MFYNNAQVFLDLCYEELMNTENQSIQKSLKTIFRIVPETMVEDFFWLNCMGRLSYSFVSSLFTGLPSFFVLPLAPKLTKKFGKKNVIVTAMLIGAISGLISLVAPITPDSKGMIIYVLCLMGLNLGNAGFQITVWAIVADCIEMSYRKTGKSEEGSLYALYSFFRKLSQGIGQAVSSLGLAAIGFVEGENAVQSANFGEKVKNLYFIVLAAGSLIAFLSMAFIYNIGKKEEAELAKTVEK